MRLYLLFGIILLVLSGCGVAASEPTITSIGTQLAVPITTPTPTAITSTFATKAPLHDLPTAVATRPADLVATSARVPATPIPRFTFPTATAVPTPIPRLSIFGDDWSCSTYLGGVTCSGNISDSLGTERWSCSEYVGGSSCSGDIGNSFGTENWSCSEYLGGISCSGNISGSFGIESWSCSEHLGGFSCSGNIDDSFGIETWTCDEFLGDLSCAGDLEGLFGLEHWACEQFLSTFDCSGYVSPQIVAITTPLLLLS